MPNAQELRHLVMVCASLLSAHVPYNEGRFSLQERLTAAIGSILEEDTHCLSPAPRVVQERCALVVEDLAYLISGTGECIRSDRTLWPSLISDVNEAAERLEHLSLLVRALVQVADIRR